MKKSPWRERVERAEYLAEKYPAAAEILRFYSEVAGFQDAVAESLATVSAKLSLPALKDVWSSESLSSVFASFESFLSLAEKVGPRRLRENANGLRNRGAQEWSVLLNQCWLGRLDPDSEVHPHIFLACAFLQPYAECSRDRISVIPDGRHSCMCLFCDRKPGLGVLRPQGDGARRSLLCSFCLAEWEFRRILCARCGEENDRRLPVYVASDFSHIRVECCDSCKHYLKTVDLTKDGLAEPVVDEIASAPLDLWAQEHGYSKIELNLLGM